jgi:hypothetical protein
MFWPRLDHPQVQATGLKHTEVKCTSSCIIFKIGSGIFSNVPLYVFETIDDMCLIDMNNLKCYTAIFTFYLSMFLELFFNLRMA